MMAFQFSCHFHQEGHGSARLILPCVDVALGGHRLWKWNEEEPDHSLEPLELT
jgi:hypothetical protein